MMKKFLLALLYCFMKMALWFRYRIKVEGLDKLTPQTLKKTGGILFLPNHPAVFVDPVAVSLAVWKKFPLRPMMIEYMYYDPAVHKIALMIDALPVPNFDTSSNSLKRKRNEEVFQSVIDGLNLKQNFLIYPAGRTKSTSLEIIGGASGVHKIIQESPNANIVLVRTKGLWGSSLSRAFTGTPPPMTKTIWNGIKHVFKNLIFFTPRREVTICFELAPKDFPYNASRLELNKYLEAWYNKPDGLSVQRGDSPGDSLMLVPYSMWDRKPPEIQQWKPTAEDLVPLSSIPENIQNEIIAKLAQVTNMKPQDIKPNLTLAFDLGLDSLDMAELIIFLQDQYDVGGVLVPDLTTVNKLMAYAAKKIIPKEATTEHFTVPKKWQIDAPRKRAFIDPGKTMPEVFLNSCARMGKSPAVGDDRVGILTFADMKLRTILLAEYIRHLPGEYIGILLPSSAATALLILAVQIAGKVPLMVNWTVGSRHLESVIQLSKVEAVLTSWAFLDRLDNVELNGLEDKLIMLEEIRPQLGLTQKLKALWRSKLSTKRIMKIFGLKNDPEGKAVLLFTSGTESMPKGVPLTHKNLLSNQRAALEDIELYSDDVFLAILPPFHSFGFTVSTLLGILSGFRTAYYPNPTDGKGLASAFERWQATLIVGAPTFIRGMFKAAKPEQLATMRLCVTGAEKATADLFLQVEKAGSNLIEGYGITECSPALTFNRPGKPHKGVGQPLNNIELIIVHPETLEILPVNTQGLILARGPNVFHGYINPGLSSPFVTVQGKSWYNSGDLGHLDENNFLTISGRLKRFVKIGGEMISLESIESALLQAAEHKGWLVTHEDGPPLAVSAKEPEGEKTKLYLFTRFDVNVDEINKALKECGFSNLVRITEVHKLSDIPIMGTGKVNYRLLENQYLGKENETR
jgi:long-chain-fatty-acid--[acyl-carrier-protein] ligase